MGSLCVSERGNDVTEMDKIFSEGPGTLEGQAGLKDTRRSIESYGQHEAVDRIESSRTGSGEPEQGQGVQETPVGSEGREVQSS